MNAPNLNEIVARQLHACESIGTYLEGRELMVDSHMEQILGATAARAKETFRSMCLLAGEHQTVQAAMLCRSIFEDMVVMHWLVLHDDDPEFLTRRFMDSFDAMRLNEARTAERHGQIPPDVSDLAAREQQLVKEFGSSAQRQWWAARRDGMPIKMPEVIAELENAERFQPRFKGEKPILREMFEKAQKWKYPASSSHPRWNSRPAQPRKPAETSGGTNSSRTDGHIPCLLVIRTNLVSCPGCRSKSRWAPVRVGLL
jgi:hypothetical protein